MKAMKRIGLIGGLSWESTRTYYDVINTLGTEVMNDEGNPEILMYSVNLAKCYPYLASEKYDEAAAYLSNAAVTLEKAGADMVLICANTPHLLAPVIQEKITVPLVHIADAVAEAIQEKKIRKVALLGTPVTMGLSFYREKLKKQYGIETIVPDEMYHERMINIICGELDHGIIKKESLDYYLRVIESVKKEGAEGIILGCTEIPLLVKQEHCDIPVFDTATLHAAYAVKLASE